MIPDTFAGWLWLGADNSYHNYAFVGGHMGRKRIKRGTV